MGKNEITGYEPLVNNLKQMIQQKQYRVLQMVNSETINLYWEIAVKTGGKRRLSDLGESLHIFSLNK